MKRVAGGKGSNFINDNFKPGVEIEVMEPKFMQVGKTWINVGGGNIAYAEESQFDNRYCLRVEFIGGAFVRLYNNMTNNGKEAEAMKWWLDKNSIKPLMESFALRNSVASEIG